MAGFNFAGFAAAQEMGQQLNADLDEKKTETAARKQQTAQMAQTMQFQKQEMDNKQAMTSGIQQYQKQQAALQSNAQIIAGTAPNTAETQADKTSIDTYRAFSKIAMNTGNLDAGLEYEKLANEAEKTADMHLDKNQKLLRGQEEEAGRAANVFMDNPTAEGLAGFRKDIEKTYGPEVAAKIPTDPKAALTYAQGVHIKGLSDAGRTAEQDRVANQKILAQARADTLAETIRRDRESESIRRGQQQLTATLAAGNMEIKRENARASRLGKENIETDKIINRGMTAAKPIQTTLDNVQIAKGFAMDESGASDKLLHQALVGMNTTLKGRATALMFKDTQHFGNIAERVEGALSLTFTGKQAAQERKQVLDLLKSTEDHVLVPNLQKIEKASKEQGKRMGLDPDNINLLGDFPRAGAAGSAPAKTAGSSGDWKDSGWKETSVIEVGGTRYTMTKGRWLDAKGKEYK